MTVEKPTWDPTIVTDSLVKQVATDVRNQNPSIRWGNGEFRNSIFEAFVDYFGLPWMKIDVGYIPNWTDNRVQELKSKLNEFEIGV